MKAFYETHYYPYHLKVWQNTYKNIQFLPHWHSEMEFIFVRQGNLEINIDGEFYQAEKDDLIICDSGLIHYSTDKYTNHELDFFIFDGRLIDSTFHGFYLKNPVIKGEFLKKEGLYEAFTHLYQTTEKELAEQDTLFDKIIISHLQAFCIAAIRAFNDLEKREFQSRYEKENIKFQKVIDYIEENYKNHIRLADAAKIMNLNPSYFSTLFSSRTNKRFIDYVNILRIENVIKEMSQSDKNITELAFSNGFNNLRTFNRVFKQFTGQTPSRYSKNQAHYQSPFNIVRKSAIEYCTDRHTNRTLIE